MTALSPPPDPGAFGILRVDNSPAIRPDPSQEPAFNGCFAPHGVRDLFCNSLYFLMDHALASEIHLNFRQHRSDPDPRRLLSS